MRELNILRSKYKKEMYKLESQNENFTLGELSTKIGTFFVSSVNGNFLSLYDSDRNWLFFVNEDDVSKLYSIKDFQEFTEVFELGVLVASDNKQKLIKTNTRAGIKRELDLVFHVGDLYFIFGSPELMTLEDLS